MERRLYDMDNDFLNKLGIPRLIISLFLAFLVAAAFSFGLPMGQIFSAMLTRFGMNSLLVLAMIPTIQAGAGPNFGLPFGIICGLIGATLAIELDLRGFTAFFFAIGVSIPLGAIAGWLYGLLLNRVKGQEMTVGTYMGFSIVSVMCIFWLMAPYKSPEMVWPYGGDGLRVTVVLDGRMEQLLDRFLSFTVNGVTIPTGLLLATALCCVLLWIFMRTRTGLAMSVVGSNPRFAEASGLNVNKYRLLASVVSCAMGAAGIVIYSQSYGFIQLYQAPLYMALYSV
ncbi:MAG: ABC transporter permease, partial [Synergistales bacterium]|nr:ABC transporter permease [Synergistales bacterium]